MKKKVMKKIVKIFVILGLVAGALSLNVIRGNANTRDANVDLADSVKNVTFTITMESSGDFDAVLTDPHGSTYSYVATSKTTMVCNLDKADAGEWVTQVSSNGEVPKYHVSVSAKKDTATEVVKDAIEIGRDIVGLKIYFRDNTLCVTWNDDSCGDVNVRVTNLNNGEMLANQSVKEQEFYLDLPEGVTDVSVGVVPTTSRNIDGAEQVFTLSIPHKPNVTVTFPEKEAINTVSIPITVSTDNEYSFIAYINEQLSYESEPTEAGEYTIDIPLVTEGENEIEFYVVDTTGNMFSYRKNITLDTVAPGLTLEETYDGITVNETPFTIGGTVVNFDALYVGEDKVAVASDGHFSYDLILHDGENNISVRATDIAGNETAYDMTINYKAGAGHINVLKVVCVVGGIALVIALIALGKKRKMHTRLVEAEEKKTEPLVRKSALFPKAKKEKKTEVPKEPVEQEVQEVKSTPAKKKNNRKIKSIILQGIELLVFAVALSLFLEYVVCVGQAVSGSMEPTIMTNGKFLVNKVAYVSREPEAGDIIMFYNPDAGKIFIKRIIGVPGDEIEFHNGYVYVNGEQRDESAYLNEDIETNGIGKFNVPDGKYFVLGDNRENSNDSRFWENPYVDMENISGKIFFIF